MHVTSHFIGILLDSRQFADLFVDLQKYFKSHGLEHAVEFQNILSLHITLYYLESSITDEERAQIMSDVANISSNKKPTISQLKVSYFGESGNGRVCYLGCPQNETLESMNRFFAKRYGHSQIPENQLTFVPHISLFRINEPNAYAPYKAEVDALINKKVHSIDYPSPVKNIHLFQVNSLFHPEIQIAL